MKNSVGGQWFELRLAQRNDGNRFANGIEHFKTIAGFLSGSALVVFHYGRNITTAEIMLGHVRFERHSTEHLKFHVLSG